MFETASIVAPCAASSSGRPVAVLPLAALVALVDDPLGPSWAADAEGQLLMRNDAASLLLADNPAAEGQLERVAADVLAAGQPTQTQVTVGSAPRRYFSVRARPVCLEDGRRAVWFQALETTVKDQLIEALRESRAMFKSLTEAVGDFAWVADAEGRFAYVSGGVPSAGLAAWDLTGRRVSELGEEAAACFLARSPTPLRDVSIRTPLGRTVCLSVAAVPILNGSQWVGARGIARNVTEERRAERMLEEARRRDRLLRQVLDGIHTGTDPTAMLENAARVTRAAFEADACRIRYGDETVEDVRAAAPRQGAVHRLRSDCRLQGEKVGVLEVERRADGWGREDSVLLGQVAVHVAMAIAQAQHLRTLERLARTDGLTGLLNRRTFEEVMARRLAMADGGGNWAGGVLLLIDLDHFKQLNDTGGHAAGDAALCEVARLLRRLAGAQDVVARFGGDEFILWLDGASVADGERAARAVVGGMEDIRQTVGAPSLSASVGFAASLGPGETLHALMLRADGALYKVKGKGRGGYAAADGKQG